MRMLLPELCLAHHVGQYCLGPFKGAPETADKPCQPWGDLERTLLCTFQNVVIRLTLQADLRRHAVETLGAVFRTGQNPVGDGARDAAVAVVEGMDGDKPEMRDGGL